VRQEPLCLRVRQAVVISAQPSEEVDERRPSLCVPFAPFCASVSSKLGIRKHSTWPVDSPTARIDSEGWMSCVNSSACKGNEHIV
jgi:hypothetical protein